MAKIKSPWDDNDDNENPWVDNIKPTPKIRPFKPKKPIEVEFKWWWILVVVGIIWLASGFYQVQPNEEAIVLRFGAYNDTTTPGLHYHLPYPIETIRKVNITQERSINLGVQEFRGMDKPTNVLSFANIDDDDFWDSLDDDVEHELGDIILSFDTMLREANEKNITLYAHYCHLLVHGFLHLLGFDHIEDEEAEEMENLEVEILSLFSVDNPYKDEEEC